MDAGMDGGPGAQNEYLQMIAQDVREGRCILFLGAGVHAPPPEASPYEYPENQRPPIGSQLSRDLAAQCGFSQRFPNDDVRDLRRVSFYYEMKKGRKQLSDYLVETVSKGKRPSAALRALAQLPFPLIITTNYDKLFERALQDADKEFDLSIYDPSGKIQTVDCDEDPPAVERPFLCKIHGDITQPASMVVTDEDYIQFVLRMSDKEDYHPVPMTFKHRFKKWSTLFIGYSLLDYNLRLLFKTLRWNIDPTKRPDSYSVDLYPDPLLLDYYDNQHRYVRFIAQNVWTFVPDLYRLIQGEEMPK